MTSKTPTYAGSGVDYSVMDPIKVLAQDKAKSTAGQLTSFGATEISASRGESAYVWEEEGCYRALVIEGLGTKNIVADAMRPYTGKTHYDTIAKDTIAMVVNDLVVVGALPQVVNAYFALGDSNWMLDTERATDLINGWAAACQESGAAWGGGETPTLKDIIYPETIDLGGSATGVIQDKNNLVLGDKLESGDAIILVESNGIHANGISFVRAMAKKDPEIYQKVLPSGRMFGEAILSPTHLYVSLVKEMQKQNTQIHYMVNITGHGWRKLMRANKELTYVIENIPKAQDEFALMQETTGVDNSEMYGNFNMGAGFAVFVPKSEVDKVLDSAKMCKLQAWVGGYVQEGPKQVVIKPLDITFKGESLEVR